MSKYTERLSKKLKIKPRLLVKIAGCTLGAIVMICLVVEIVNHSHEYAAGFEFYKAAKDSGYSTIQSIELLIATKRKIKAEMNLEKAIHDELAKDSPLPLKSNVPKNKNLSKQKAVTLSKPNNYLYKSIWDGEGVKITGIRSKNKPLNIVKLIIPAKIKGMSVKQISFEEEDFNNLARIESIELPDTIESIADNAFKCCESLTTINLPSSLIEIGNNAFANCSSLKSINLPPSLKRIEDNAFMNCSSLEEINLPPSLIKIGSGAFSRCYSLKKIEIPKYIASLSCRNTVWWDLDPQAYGVFSFCISLKSVKLPEGLLIIGDATFYNCYSLKEIHIPDSVETISDNAFSGCTVLKTINLPKSIKILSKNAFDGCKGLKNITIDGIEKNIKDIEYDKYDGIPDKEYLILANEILLKD